MLESNKRLLNFLDILGVCGLLLIAFIMEFFLHESPCPLCWLQRLALIGMAMGILFNLRFGISSRHYAIAMLNALFGAAVALRQISLHIVPGTETFGPAILFGWHLYTWSFLGFVAALFYLALLLYLGESREYLKS